MSKSYLEFTEIRVSDRKTKVWHVESAVNASYLGTIHFLPAWRKYVFSPAGQTMFDVFCLQEITAHCVEATLAWKQSL